MRWRWWGGILLLLVGIGLGLLGGNRDPVAELPTVAGAASLPAVRAAVASQLPVARPPVAAERLPAAPTSGYTAALIDNPYAEANRLRLAGKPGTYVRASALFFWCAIVRMDLPELKALAAGKAVASQPGRRPFEDAITNAARSKAIQLLEMRCADLGDLEAWQSHGDPDPDGQRFLNLNNPEDRGPSRQRRLLEELARQGVLAEHLRRLMTGANVHFFEGQLVPAVDEMAYLTAVEMASDEVIYTGFDYAKSVRGLHLCAVVGLCSASLTPREVAMHWAQTDPAGRALPKYYDRVLAAIRANRYQAFMAPLR